MKKKICLLLVLVLAALCLAGCRLEAEGNAAGAYDAFMALNDYKGCGDRAAESLYESGLRYREEGKWEESVNAFSALGNYSDSELQIKKTWYEKGCSDYDDGEYKDALGAFLAAYGYSDADVKAEEICYVMGNELLSENRIQEAITAYSGAGDYLDAREKYQELTYQYAGELYNGGHYQEAIEAYKSIRDYMDVDEILARAETENALHLIKQQESADLISDTTIYDGSQKLKEYLRPEKNRIHMPAGDDYTRRKLGVLTFRGNAFRQNAAVGEVKSAAGLTEIWRTEAGSSDGIDRTYYGYEWTGQPVIEKWSIEVRESSNINDEKKNKTALREVIIAGADGVIRFLDLEDGSPTRDAIDLGYPIKGTPSLHPAGYPYMSVGQSASKTKDRTGSIGLRQYNLYNQKELDLIDGLDGKLKRGINGIGSFETSPLIDRVSDSMITPGSNGLLYLTSLNMNFDYRTVTMETDPRSIVMASRAKEEKNDELTAVESSHAMYDKYVFYADMGGILRCVDTDTLTVIWAADTGDSVYAAVALDQRYPSELDLYTANMLNLRREGKCQIRRYNALDGKEIWTVEIGVEKESEIKEDAGAKASPVIGQKGLSELVFFTVTGLDAKGRSMLGLRGDEKASLVALEKDTGKIRWAKGLSDRSESSPVAVYDMEGNGWIIQCAEDGTILLLEGRTGAQQAELQIEGKIKASPAVYNDIMVIGTTGEGTEYVYGISIKESFGETETKTPSDDAEGTAVPKDAADDPDRMMDRLCSFFDAWSGNRLDDMLELCEPGWKQEQENPRTSFFGLQGNRIALDCYPEKIFGTDADSIRKVTVITHVDRNNGKPPETHRMEIVMVKENGDWYINPRNLKEYELAEDQDQSAAPSPEPSKTPPGEPVGNCCTFRRIIA